MYTKLIVYLIVVNYSIQVWARIRFGLWITDEKSKPDQAMFGYQRSIPGQVWIVIWGSGSGMDSANLTHGYPFPSLRKKRAS
jgi:hypothetical protein